MRSQHQVCNVFSNCGETCTANTPACSPVHLCQGKRLVVPVLSPRYVTKGWVEFLTFHVTWYQPGQEAFFFMFWYLQFHRVTFKIKETNSLPRVADMAPVLKPFTSNSPTLVILWVIRSFSRASMTGLCLEYSSYRLIPMWKRSQLG